MTTKVKQVAEAQGATSDKPIGGVVPETIKEKVLQASQLFKDRYFSIYPMFGELAYEMVEYYKSTRGGKQWAEFVKQTKEVNDQTSTFYSYYVSLSQAFELDTAYDQYDISVKVLEVREEHDLPAFETYSTKECITEFCKVFLYDSSNRQLTPTIKIVK
jgi:hypothetical protein